MCSSSFEKHSRTLWTAKKSEILTRLQSGTLSSISGSTPFQCCLSITSVTTQLYVFWGLQRFLGFLDWPNWLHSCALTPNRDQGSGCLSWWFSWWQWCTGQLVFSMRWSKMATLSFRINKFKETGKKTTGSHQWMLLIEKPISTYFLSNMGITWAFTTQFYL